MCQYIHSVSFMKKLLSVCPVVCPSKLPYSFECVISYSGHTTLFWRPLIFFKIVITVIVVSLDLFFHRPT